MGVAREAITYAGRKVVAIIDREARSFQMVDAGFNQVEEVRLEIFKGTISSTDVMDVDGISVPLDLRGVIPKNLDPVVIDGVNRVVKDFDSSGMAWVIATIKAN